MASLISSLLCNFLLISFTFYSFFLITSHAFDGRKPEEESCSNRSPRSCSPHSEGPRKSWRSALMEVLNNQDKASTPSKKTFRIPVRFGKSLKSTNYIVRLRIGTVKSLTGTPSGSPVTLQLDTGSVLTWIQCGPCEIPVHCHRQIDPFFNPSNSKTREDVDYDEPKCKDLCSSTGYDRSRSSEGKCAYDIRYVDRSCSNGLLVKDTLDLISDTIQNFYFGCGRNNKGKYGKTAGILGLGKGPHSIVSQLAEQGNYKKYFAYCLPARSSETTGYLKFGKSEEAPRDVKFTPFSDESPGDEPYYYYIDIIGIKVGETELFTSSSGGFEKVHTVIDSGASLTRLPEATYSALRAQFEKEMMKSKYPSAVAEGKWDTCFDLSYGEVTESSIPNITFTFPGYVKEDGDVKVDIPLGGRIVQVNWKLYCLPFTRASKLPIFGNRQQMTMEVVHDVAGKKIGFGPHGTC